MSRAIIILKTNPKFAENVAPFVVTLEVFVSVPRALHPYVLVLYFYHKLLKMAEEVSAQ